MSDETNRFLTEAMGECWHEYDVGRPVLTCKGVGMICRKCRELVLTDNNFASIEDFEKLWAWAEAQQPLRVFLARFSPPTLRQGTPEGRGFFADALCRFLTASKR